MAEVLVPECEDMLFPLLCSLAVLPWPWCRKPAGFVPLLPLCCISSTLWFHLCFWDDKTTCWSVLCVASPSPLFRWQEINVMSIHYFSVLHVQIALSHTCHSLVCYTMVLSGLRSWRMCHYRVAFGHLPLLLWLWPPSTPQVSVHKPTLWFVWIVLGCRSSPETFCPGAANYRCPAYQPKSGHRPHWLN